jgi:hypothetical protein
MRKPLNAARPGSPIESNWDVAQLPGLDSEDQQKLKDCDIKTTQQLVQRTNSPDQKHLLAAQLKVHVQHVNKWAALANLSRIPAVGCEHCGLLLHSGISSPVQLAQTSVQVVHKQILRFCVTTLRRQDLCPPPGEVLQWIQQAQLLR